MERATHEIIQRMFAMVKQRCFSNFGGNAKTIVFHQAKNIDFLKLGCTLPNLTGICLHESTDTKIYTFKEADKDLLEKMKQSVVGGPSIVSTRKEVVDQTFNRNSKNICKSNVGTDASQLN